MRAWLDDWYPQTSFAGIEGVGACDAWSITALHLEQARCESAPAILTSFDLFKAFDQINRPLMYALMATAGVPKQVLGPYVRYLEGVRVHGVYAGG
eukprot:26498-Alexandrium_andersonii.AAC.1